MERGNMPINDVQLLSGYFYDAIYYEYDLDTKEYLDGISFRYKQNDEGVQGVSSGGKKAELQQVSQGRRQTVYTFTIKTIANLPFKPMDNVKLLSENRNYTITEMYEDYSSINTLDNFQFKQRTKNKPKVLILGEK